MSIKKILALLGPGLLFASMAIGTSHLVLSTKAGAQYGWLMFIPILAANLLKYPFFEFGIRFTHIKKQSLLEGYAAFGKKYLWGYSLITAISACTILSALYIVTAGLLKQLLPWFTGSDGQMAMILFAGISALLVIGQYALLEKAIKILLIGLCLSLLITTSMVLFKGPISPEQDFEAPLFFDSAGLLFLIGLMGWMPTAVEASSWISMWRLEKTKQSGSSLSLKEVLLEFNIGYILTALLALCFLVIGWYTLYGSGTQLSGSAAIFSNQLIHLFTIHMGSWAYYFIALAAFATMFSSCMTAHDALARIGMESIRLLKSKPFTPKKEYYTWTVILLGGLNASVIWWASGNMGLLVTIATFTSFVFAPAIGLLNHKMVTQKSFPTKGSPPKWMLLLSYIGIASLSLFAIYYCYVLWL